MEASANDLAKRFGTWDYIVFAATLLFSAGIGIVFGCTGGKQKTASEFLMGNRKMSLLPTSMSLIASFTSAVLVMGLPAEVYSHGTMFIWFLGGFLLAILISTFLYIPLFYRLKLTSVFEYIERRFNRPVRLLAVTIYIVQMLMYLSIVLYTPSLALSAVTGLPVYASVLSMGVVCTFYTALGGMKAVMWTDTFQVAIMLAGMLAIVARGCQMMGVDTIWRDGVDSGRVDLFDWSTNLDPNPLVRHTVWSLVIGNAFNWAGTYGVNQAQVQRALAVPHLRTAQLAYWINVPGQVIMTSLAWFSGLILYSHYKGCDPVRSGQVTAGDQMIILYVLEVLGHLPGLSGLVVSAAFCGSLSTLSTGYNSLAAVVLTDIVALKLRMSDERAAKISKGLAAGFGLLSIALAFVVSKMGTFFIQINLSIFGMIGGPVLALFTMGIFYPWVNSKGAAAGLIASLGVTLWIGVGSVMYKPYIHKYPISIADCNLTTTTYFALDPYSRDNSTLFTNVSQLTTSTMPHDFPTSSAVLLNATTLSLQDMIDASRSGIRGFYSLSYLWLSPLAMLITTVISHLVSAVTGFNRADNVDPSLISPLYGKYNRCLPAAWRKALAAVDSKRIYADEAEECLQSETELGTKTLAE